ncbi:hypothetical protein ACWDBO_35380 [Streptomyces mirabilis]|uniref:hypothetical protein n=1 Tax=Streptomyces mirabilis TaxID=68239 RepID=UPI0031BA4C3F
MGDTLTVRSAQCVVVVDACDFLCSVQACLAVQDVKSALWSRCHDKQFDDVGPEVLIAPQVRGEGLQAVQIKRRRSDRKTGKPRSGWRGTQRGRRGTVIPLFIREKDPEGMTHAVGGVDVDEVRLGLEPLRIQQKRPEGGGVVERQEYGSGVLRYDGPRWLSAAAQLVNTGRRHWQGSAGGVGEDRVDGGAEGGRVGAFFVLVGVASDTAGPSGFGDGETTGVDLVA